MFAEINDEDDKVSTKSRNTILTMFALMASLFGPRVFADPGVSSLFGPWAFADPYVYFQLGPWVFANASISPEVQSMDLGGGCRDAQRKAAQYANQIAQAASATPSACNSAKANRKLGEIMVRVAESCQNLPTWTQEKLADEQMIRQSDQAISGLCQ